MRSTLTIPSTTKHLSDVRQFVADAAAEAGLAPEAVHAVCLAVDEACTNAIKHAYKNRDDGEVTVRTSIGNNRFTIIISHTGDPFDRSHYHPPAQLAEHARRRRRGGFGITLMNRLMDNVEFRKRGERSEVKLVKLVDS